MVYTARKNSAVARSISRYAVVDPAASALTASAPARGGTRGGNGISASRIPTHQNESQVEAAIGGRPTEGGGELVEQQERTCFSFSRLSM